MSDLHTPRGHEQRDINPRAVMWAAIGLVLALVFVFIGIRVFEFVIGIDRHVNASRSLPPGIEVPPPQLQANPAADLAALRAAGRGEVAELRLGRSASWRDPHPDRARDGSDRRPRPAVARGKPAERSQQEGRKVNLRRRIALWLLLRRWVLAICPSYAPRSLSDAQLAARGHRAATRPARAAERDLPRRNRRARAARRVLWRAAR